MVFIILIFLILNISVYCFFKVYAEISNNDGLNKPEPEPANFGLTVIDSNMAEPAPKAFLEANTAD